MPLREYAGAAAATRLSGVLASGTVTNFAVITGGGTGYPSGATAPFVVVIDRGTALEEKILVTSRAGDTFTGLTRGYDGTTAQAHASQAIVEHVLDASTLSEVNAHTNTTTRDDHTQYLNVARHDTTTRHPITNLDMVGLTAALIPSGTIWMTANASAPAGWLMCDGSAVLRTTYAALYAALGGASSPYGQGDGSTTFNVPDFRGRVPVGVGTGTGGGASGTGAPTGGAALSALARGGWKGEESHVLVTGELASHGHSHTHGAHSHSHGHSVTVNADATGESGHSHSHDHNSSPTNVLIVQTGAGPFNINGSGSNWVTGDAGHTTRTDTNANGSSGHSHSHGHGASSGTDATAATPSADATTAGSGTAHNNIQPQLCIPFMIKT